MRLFTLILLWVLASPALAEEFWVVGSYSRKAGAHSAMLDASSRTGAQAITARFALADRTTYRILVPGSSVRRSDLVAHGYSPWSIVRPETSIDVVFTSEELPDRSFYLVLGAYSSEQGARAAARQHDAQIRTRRDDNLVLVVRGPFERRRESTMNQAQAAGIEDAWWLETVADPEPMVASEESGPSPRQGAIGGPLADAGQQSPRDLESNDAAVRKSAEHEQLWQLLGATSDRLKATMAPDSVRSAREHFDALEAGCDVPIPERFNAPILRAEADAVDRDHGLEVRGGSSTADLLSEQTQRSGDTATGDVLDEETQPSGSTYVELAWNLYKGGLVENNRTAKRLQTEASLAEIDAGRQAFARRNQCIRQGVGELFSGTLHRLYSLKYELMRSVYEIERRAYFNGWSYLDDFLVSEQDISEIVNALQAYDARPGLDSYAGTLLNPPLVDLDIARLLGEVRSNSNDLRETHLRRRLLEMRRNQADESSVRLFLRKQMPIFGSARDELVAGVRFSVPLHDADQDEVIDARLHQVDAEARMRSWQRVRRVKTSYVQLQSQLGRAIPQQYRFFRAAERARRSFAADTVGIDTEVAVAVTRVRALLDAAIELARAKEELYRRVHEVFLAAESEFDLRYLVTEVAQTGQDPSAVVRTGERSTYLWSTFFNQTPNDVLLDLMEAKAIREVLLSVGRYTDQPKAERFIGLAGKRGVDVVPIVGANEWIRPKHHRKAYVESLQRLELTGGIHLDIEPHQVSGYRDDQAAYMQNYLELVRGIRDAIGDARLSVSVPVHWDESVYAALNHSVDDFYFMAYGTSDLARLESRMHKVLEFVPGRKVVVALRSEDFPQESSLERAIDHLAAGTGIQRFAIHGFEDLFAGGGASAVPTGDEPDAVCGRSRYCDPAGRGSLVLQADPSGEPAATDSGENAKP